MSSSAAGDERSASRERAAERVAREELARVPDWLWDGRTLPVPVETIADSHYRLLVEEVSGLATRLDPADPIHVSGLLYPSQRLILIDAEEAARAPGRRRFSIAHELGHWILHCAATHAEAIWCEDSLSASAITDETARLRATRTQEIEANAFAAAVLMPRELFLADPRPDGENEEYRLARRFGVSRDALRRRYETLDSPTER
ncbi:MAG: ImmA/IrrE family metallo-endopeptidase [Actinomycetota bacterium]|nr:ImmA/IrrE family metallo-endopeptidase [Actinomycetota bacterium]